MTIREFINTEFHFKTETHTKRFAKFKSKFISILSESGTDDSIEFNKQILFYTPISEILSAKNINELNTILQNSGDKVKSYRHKHRNTKRIISAKSKNVAYNELNGIYDIEGIISKSNDLLQYIEKVPFAKYADNANMYNLVKNIKAQIVSAKAGLTRMYNKTKEV